MNKAVKNLFFLAIILFLQQIKGFSQNEFLTNPSLEGPRGREYVPYGWFICDPQSTPDTQPGVWTVTLQPSNGYSYINLVLRGSISPYAGHPEDCGTQLLKPLLKNNCYNIKLDLAKSNEFKHDSWSYGYVYYKNPGILSIYGGYNKCDTMELLAETPPITNETWQTYEFTLNPKQTDVNYILLRAKYIGDSIYFGNILIDNIRLERVVIPVTVHPFIYTNYGEPVTLTSDEAVFYSWSNSQYISCDSCQTTVANLPYSDSVVVVKEFYSPCDVQKEYFFIFVKPVIPDVITPNNDGYNDKFEIGGLPPNSELTITDRWGQVVYLNPNYDNSWGGLKDGNLLPPDTYWYKIKLPITNEVLTGSILIKF